MGGARGGRREEEIIHRLQHGWEKRRRRWLDAGGGPCSDRIAARDGAAHQEFFATGRRAHASRGRTDVLRISGQDPEHSFARTGIRRSRRKSEAEAPAIGGVSGKCSCKKKPRRISARQA